MKTDEQVFCYVAILPCGCVTGAHVDSEEHRKDIVKFIGEAIMYGADVDRKSVEWVLENFKKCQKHSVTEKQLELFPIGDSE